MYNHALATFLVSCVDSGSNNSSLHTLRGENCMLTPRNSSCMLLTTPKRQLSTNPINTTPLLLGACLAMGMCYCGTGQKGCYTSACSSMSNIGGVCSCNADVQAALSLQVEKGHALWPVKCPLTRNCPTWAMAIRMGK